MAVLRTQSSSKARLKNDTLGDQALLDLFEQYKSASFEEFRTYAEALVISGGGKQPMKDAMIAEFHKPMATKSTILIKTQNFILAGMGLGV